MSAQLREELFDDFANSLERLEQPLSCEWMQARGVSIEEVEALSAKAALILRAYRALDPGARVAFVAHGIFARPQNPAHLAETNFVPPNSGPVEETTRTTMKVKVTRRKKTTEEVEIALVEIVIPRDEIDDHMPAIPPALIDAFSKDGGDWKIRVGIETGQIEGWPGGVLDLFCKPVDRGTYRLLDSAGEKVAEIVENYVPNLLIPGDFGDYIGLNIDATGKISKWPTEPDVTEFFKDDEDGDED